MRSFLLAAILLALSPATPGVADEPGSDKWFVHCGNDPESDWRACTINYMMPVPVDGRAGWAAIVIGWTGGPAGDAVPYLHAGPAAGDGCDGEPVMLRVDANEAVTLPAAIKGHGLWGVEARQMIDQFRAGSRVVMRARFVPECRSTDLTLTLNGFAAAWYRFEAAREQ